MKINNNNSTDLKTLHAKAEAFDKGTETWVVTDKDGNFIAAEETELNAWHVTRKLGGWPETYEPIPTYKCRKVRVCEELSQNNN